MCGKLRQRARVRIGNVLLYPPRLWLPGVSSLPYHDAFLIPANRNEKVARYPLDCVNARCVGIQRADDLWSGNDLLLSIGVILRLVVRIKYEDSVARSVGYQLTIILV